jgi:hypothetical protein
MRIEARLSELNLALPPRLRRSGDTSPAFKSARFGSFRAIYRSSTARLCILDISARRSASSKLCRSPGMRIELLGANPSGARLAHRLQSIVLVEGHVSCAPGFTAHAKVLDGATDLFLDVLGARAGHARTAFGHNELPLNAPLELVLTVLANE